jgi:transposase
MPIFDGINSTALFTTWFMSHINIISNIPYQLLWNTLPKNQYDVERAFRISKTDLKIRPIYHRLKTRIEAHILISFVAYALYKEFERKIKQSNIDIKFKIIFDHIKTMYGYKTHYAVQPLEMDEIQKQIYDAIYCN